MFKVAGQNALGFSKAFRRPGTIVLCPVCMLPFLINGLFLGPMPYCSSECERHAQERVHEAFKIAT